MGHTRIVHEGVLNRSMGDWGLDRGMWYFCGYERGRREGFWYELELVGEIAVCALCISLISTKYINQMGSGKLSLK